MTDRIGPDYLYKDMSRSALGEFAMEAARSKALSNLDKNQCWYVVMVWDKDGNCRCYDANHDNYHWSVPKLDGLLINESRAMAFA